MLRMRGNRLQFLQELGQRYGDVAFFRIGPIPVYFLNQPQLIREVLVSRAGSFRKLRQVMRPLRNGMGNVLLTTEDLAWRKRRSMLQTVFRADHMVNYTREITDCTQAALAAYPLDRPLNVEQEMTLLTQTIMFRVLFGVDPPTNATQLANAVRLLSDIYYLEASDVIALPEWLPRPRNLQKWRAKAILMRTVDDLLARHAAGEVQSEFLTLLSKQAAEASEVYPEVSISVRDEAASLLVAGYHTTSVALAWMWYLLSQHQEVQSHIRAESDTARSSGEFASSRILAQLPLTEMAVKESLRLYPAAWQLFGREAIVEVEVGEFRLPRGSWVLISPFVTHRDARYFAEPERFDPERFSSERSRQIDPFAYIPFGAGAHACIGKSLTLLEMTLIAAMVLEEFEVELAPGQRTPRYEARVALRPRQDIRIVLRRRSRVSSLPAFSLGQQLPAATPWAK